MTEKKRFHFGYVCGDTGLIDEQAEHQWFIENCCSITDLKKNWKTVCDKLNELHKENEELKKENKELQITTNFWKEQCGHRINEHKHHYFINDCRCTADDFIHELKKGYKGLQEENEELKTENKILKKNYNILIDDIEENY